MNQDQVNVVDDLGDRTRFQPSFSHVLPSSAPCKHTFAPVGASILEDASVPLGDINTARIPPGSLHHASITTVVQNLITYRLCLDHPGFLRSGRARSCLLLHEKRDAVVHVLRLYRITNFTLAVPITFLPHKCA